MRESMNQPLKKPSLFVVISAWTLLSLSLISAWSNAARPHERENLISTAYGNPSGRNMSLAMAQLVGANIVGILACILGIHMAKRGKTSGKLVAILAACGIIINCYGLTKPSGWRNIIDYNMSNQVICPSGSEFTFIFPHKYKTRQADSGGKHILLYESADSNATAYCRAEVAQYDTIELEQVDLNITLSKQLGVLYLDKPSITIANEKGIRIGTYSGMKDIAGHLMQYYGKVYLGRHTMLTCFVIDPAEYFPSKDTVLFFQSIK